MYGKSFAFSALPYSVVHSASELELLVPQHIKQRIAAPDGSEQIGPLRHRRAHQQAAVGASTNGEAIGRGVVVVDEIFGGREKVVEDVLLLLEHGRLVPRLSVLVAAAQIGQREESALLHPPRILGVPLRTAWAHRSRRTRSSAAAPCRRAPVLSCRQ